MPEPPSEVPLSFSQLLNPSLSRRPHSSIGFAASLGLDELAIPPKSPHSNTRKRNFSTNAAISTEREPIIRASKRQSTQQEDPPGMTVRASRWSLSSLGSV